MTKNRQPDEVLRAMIAQAYGADAVPDGESGFAGLGLPSFGSSDAFARGYGLAPLDEDGCRRRRLYTLYLILVMVIETRYRGHQDLGQYDWARERLTELMGLYGRRSVLSASGFRDMAGISGFPDAIDVS